MGLNISILPTLFVVLWLVISGVLIAMRRWRGAPPLSEPRCAKCNYDLRGFTSPAPVRCSECGADLTVRHAVVWGTYQCRPGRIWLGILGGVLPLIILFLVSFAFRPSAMSPRSRAFIARSNAAVIASLATSANMARDWQELEKRQADGTLSDAEVGQAIDNLIVVLKKNQSRDPPLSCSDQFLSKADSAGKITDEQYLRLAKAYYKSATVLTAGRIRRGARLPIVILGGTAEQLPGLECVLALRQVTISGGRRLSVISDRDQDDPDYLSTRNQYNIDCHTTLDVSPGDYVLTFAVDAAALVEKTAPQVVDDLPGQANRWPKARAAWTDVITVPITVVASDQSPISLVTDPALDPQRTGAVHVAAIRVIRKGSGKQVSVDLTLDGKQLACSFDVILRIAGKEYPLGIHVADANGTSCNQHACDLPSLDASVLAADVLLRPNPKYAEGMPSIDRVWGGPIDVLNVPLQRYDLQSK